MPNLKKIVFDIQYIISENLINASQNKHQQIQEITQKYIQKN